MSDKMAAMAALDRMYAWHRAYFRDSNIDDFDKDQAALAVLRGVVEERDKLKKQVEALYRRDKRIADEYWAEVRKP